MRRGRVIQGKLNKHSVEAYIEILLEAFMSESLANIIRFFPVAKLRIKADICN